MAGASTVWLSIHSTAGKLGGSAADHSGINEVETPFLVHGINKQEILSRSFCIATVKTHFCITLQKHSNHLRASNSATTWPYTPPCSPEDSQHLQQALFDSYQSHRTDGNPEPAKRSSPTSLSESSTSLDVLDSQDIVTSIIDLSDWLVDRPSIGSNQGQAITIKWVTDAVLNEAPGTFGQNDCMTALSAYLNDALSDRFCVSPSSKEDGEWVEVEV